MNEITSKVHAITVKVNGRNSTTPHVGLPPYVHNRTNRLSRFLSVISLTLLLLLSIPTLVLKAFGYNFIEINAEMGFYLVNDEGQGKPADNGLVAALPHNLFRVPEKLVLVVAMLNILLSMAHLGFLVWDWRAGRRTQTRAFRRNAMILHIINAVLVLCALIAISVAHKKSSTFQYQLIPKDPNVASPSGYRYFRYDSGTFDLETWTCELKDARGVGDARKDYSAQCHIEVAGRMIMTPFFLAAVTITMLSVWALIVGGKEMPYNEQIYTKDVDLEYVDLEGGKGTGNGKQVQVGEVELDTLRPERQFDARLSKIEEDAEEPEEASKDTAPPANVEAETTGLFDSKNVDTRAGATAA